LTNKKLVDKPEGHMSLSQQVLGSTVVGRKGKDREKIEKI
jgi:hypothetical protein